LEVIRRRRPNEAAAYLTELERVGGAQAPCLRGVQAAAALLDQEGFEHAGVGARPSWREPFEGPALQLERIAGRLSPANGFMVGSFMRAPQTNLLSGAPSDAEHVQGVARDAPLELGTPSSGVAHCGTYFSGHCTSPSALPDLSSTTHAPSIEAFQPTMRRMWGHSGRLGRPLSGLPGLRTLTATSETHGVCMVGDLRRSHP